jgi:ligand-binding sensor protein
MGLCAYPFFHTNPLTADNLFHDTCICIQIPRILSADHTVQIRYCIKILREVKNMCRFPSCFNPKDFHFLFFFAKVITHKKVYIHCIAKQSKNKHLRFWRRLEKREENMHLKDLLPLDDWVVFEKNITERFGLDANVFDPDGIRITNYKNWINRLCPEIKANDKGQSFICAVAHQNIAILAKQMQKPVIEECDAGLTKIVVPIFVDSKFLGAACACGMLIGDGEVDSFLINKITGIDEAVIEALSVDIPVITMEKAESTVQFVEKKLAAVTNDFKAKM